jgi:antitoxin ParD1/3/4
MKIKGIKRGKFIELVEETSLEDGTQVFVEISEYNRDSMAQWKQLKSVIGEWKDNKELTAIFKEVDQQRHTEMGQEMDLDDLF